MRRGNKEMILTYKEILKDTHTYLTSTKSYSNNTALIDELRSKGYRFDANQFMKVLVAGGIITHVNDKLRWNGPTPTNEMLLETLKRIQNYNRERRSKNSADSSVPVATTPTVDSVEPVQVVVKRRRAKVYETPAPIYRRSGKLQPLHYAAIAFLIPIVFPLWTYVMGQLMGLVLPEVSGAEVLSHWGVWFASGCVFLIGFLLTGYEYNKALDAEQL